VSELSLTRAERLLFGSSEGDNGKTLTFNDSEASRHTRIKHGAAEKAPAS
jgi:hypothetical protein